MAEPPPGTSDTPTTPRTASPPAGPVEPHKRLETLDMLRGVAILGIFVVNIPFLAGPLPEAMTASMLTHDQPGTLSIHVIVKWLFEYKFMGLFATLFGAGMALQWMRNVPSGRQAWRMALLMILGLGHATLLWYGDILFEYGIVGLVMIGLLWLRPRTMLWLGAGCVGMQILMIALLTILGTLAQPPPAKNISEPAAQAVADGNHADLEANDEPHGEGVTSASRWQRFGEAMSESQGDIFHPGWAEAERIAYAEGPMGLTIRMRSITFLAAFVFLSIFGGFIFRIAGLFLLGAALMKLGFFNREHVAWHRLIMLLVLPAGILLEGAAVGIILVTTESAVGGLVGETLHALASVALLIGYIGTGCWIVHADALRPVRQAFAAVGRMALTNYLLQSLIASIVFYWWGLGLFGQIEPPGQIAMVLAVFAGQIALSMLWLRAFRFGPIEWLWRTLTYGRMQPMVVKRASSR